MESFKDEDGYLKISLVSLVRILLISGSTDHYNLICLYDDSSLFPAVVGHVSESNQKKKKKKNRQILALV